MINDLISREALKKAFEDTVCIEPMPYAFVKQIIDNAPTVERPQGEWVYGGSDGDQYNYYLWYECNQCKATSRKKSNFCPNCGADMRGEE